MKLTQKTILITGASSGIGRGIAEALASRSNRLILTARREPLLAEVADIVRGKGSACVIAPADATDADACQRVIDAGIDTFGPLDVALLNAGGGQPMQVADASIEQITQIMRVNYDSLVHFLVPLIAHMRDREALIAHTGSPAGFLGLPNSGPYCAAKAAGRILMDTCRIELADNPLRFIDLYPGFTSTPGLDPANTPSPALVIPTERAVREMIGAMERGSASHMFPKRIASLMGLARILPEPVRRAILRAAS